MDFDMAPYLLVDAIREKDYKKVVSQSKEAYRKNLAEALMMNRTRILSFWNKPPNIINGIFTGVSSDCGSSGVHALALNHMGLFPAFLLRVVI